MSEYASSNQPKQTPDMLDFESLELDAMADAAFEAEAAERAARLAQEREENLPPYEDLGGHPVEDLNMDQKKAIVAAGLGNNAMRLEVARAVQAETDARQQALNKEHIAAIRAQKIEQDRANGIDVDSAEYRANLRLQEERRGRRF